MRGRGNARSLATALLLAAAASAGPALAKDSGLARCLAIADMKARVACYDAIARAEVAAQKQASPAPQASVPPTAAKPKVSAVKSEPSAATTAQGGVPTAPQTSAAPAIAATKPQVSPAKSEPSAEPAAPPASKPAPTVAQASPPPTAVKSMKERRAEFGLSPAEVQKRRLADEAPLDQIEAVVVSTRRVGAGFWQITLKDGSVWRVTEARTLFRPPHAGDTVVLRRASLGSYLLDVGRQASIRAKRIR